MKTELRTVKDTAKASRWSTDEKYGDIVTEITGPLADRVLARSGKTGKVTIEEKYWNSGYCDTCAWPEHTFNVMVGDELVYQASDAGYSTEVAEFVSNFAEFNDWLEGGEDW